LQDGVRLPVLIQSDDINTALTFAASFKPRKRTITPLRAMAHCVFISSLLCEDSDGAAAQLKEALEAAGISVFVCEDNDRDDTARALDACELFVVLGTEGYGTQGTTSEELQFAKDRRKPIFLVKRCDAFLVDPLDLPASMLFAEWPSSTDMPEDLVVNIRATLEATAGPDIAPPITAAQMCVC
jgi:hypothetical protein